MNDMQKPTSASVKIDTLIAKQENVRKVGELRLSGRNPIGSLEFIPPVKIVNALPNIGDGQDFTLPLDELATGNVMVELSEWESMYGAYSVWFKIDDEVDWGERHTVELGFGTAEFAVPLGDAAFDHGTHTVEYYVKSIDDGNETSGIPSPFFIDLRDPNLGQQPAKPVLPGDMVDGIITPEYLDTHASVTFTLPIPMESLPGDTYSFHVGEIEVVTDQPAQAPYLVEVARGVFDALPEGSYPISYSLKDRVGNRSLQSIAAEVFLSKFSISAPYIPEGPEITLRDAQDGVLVFPKYDSPAPGDFVTVLWHGSPQDSIHYPLEYVVVPYADIAKPGLVYTGQVAYQLNRNGVVHDSADTTVFVNLNDPNH